MENRPGRINSICELLAQNQLNIWAFTIQDRGDFGLMKLVVDKPAQAQLVLADRGLACVLKDVLAITAQDKPGNLNKLTAGLYQKKVNIKDMYGFVSPNDRQGICFIEFENPDAVDIAELISSFGFRVLTNEELYEL
jgi:hypothetical protein